MGILEQVTQLKNQGITDEQIITELQQQGISPREINDALSQSQVKNAVAGQDMEAPMPQYDQQSNPYTPQTQEYSEQQTYDQYAPQNYQPQQEAYYPQAGYDQSAQTTTDTDTIIEVANQVFIEKIKKIENKVNELNEFKTLTKSKVDNIDARLTKIETTISQLQSAIIQKVGAYGENLSNIKKEMNMMQDSFRKVTGSKAVKKHSAPKLKRKTTKRKTSKK